MTNTQSTKSHTAAELALKASDQAVHATGKWDETITPLEQLFYLENAVNAAQLGIAAAVQEARATGATWAEIAAPLGITRQGAQQQFSR